MENLKIVYLFDPSEEKDRQQDEGSIQKKTKQLEAIGRIIKKRIIQPKEECLRRLENASDLLREEADKAVRAIFCLIRKAMVQIGLAILLVIVGVVFCALEIGAGILLKCLICVGLALAMLLCRLLVIKILIRQKIKGEKI